MKRFIQVVLQTEGTIDGQERTNFENRCSCAVACGYIPCGDTLQMGPDISSSGSGSDGDFRLDIETTNRVCMVQSFYDPEGKATLICAHCTKCETCNISPEEDAYCSKFQDACYQEDADDDEELQDEDEELQDEDEEDK